MTSRIVEILSYNTALQGLQGVPQDLVDWLSPALQTSAFLSHGNRAPDIIAVGFQETLPIYHGLAGLTSSVMKNREQHILDQIEAHVPGKERYVLVDSIVHAGVALLIYVLDKESPCVFDVQRQWIGTGPAYMGNKGAVGVRLRVAAEGDGVGETYTFVCAHLTAHAHKLKHRIRDYHHIVETLTFPPLPNSQSTQPTTIYDTSHLFFFGDLNFRIDLPDTHALYGQTEQLHRQLSNERQLENFKQYDQLFAERLKGSVFIGLREGDFWKFRCSYKYKLGEVDKYDDKRTPSWTDRVLYATHTDSPDTPEASNITNMQYTSVLGYTTSDHKPIVARLLIPAPQPNLQTVPVLKLPHHYTPTPDPFASLKRYYGLLLDRLVGYSWWLLSFFGAGSTVVGIFNFIIGLGIWRWYRRPAA